MKKDWRVFFSIPLSAKKDEEQWARVNELLDLTIGSIQNQVSRNFTVLICGHDEPRNLAKYDATFVEFLPANFAKPASADEARRDKGRKRRVIATEVGRRGGGYFMYLDADDLVHRDLVQAVTDDNNGIGYLITRGYALDFGNRLLAEVPGVWNKRFDEVCGSSGIVLYEQDDLPSTGYPDAVDRSLLFFQIKNHTQFGSFEIRNGQKLAALNFPAAIYCVNNSINLSNRLVRTEQRQQQLISKIANMQIRKLDAIRRDFSLESFL